MKRATIHRNRVRAVGGIRAAARAFTIIEATIVIGIIALLVSILLLTIGHVRRKGDVVAEQAMVTTLQKAVEKYKQEYGSVPPLVVDTGNGSAPLNLAGPISGTTIVVWLPSDLSDPNTTLNGSVMGGSPYVRKCYSELSLAYYLVGALDKDYDGIDGIGFTALSTTSYGQFSKHGRKVDPLLDVTQQKTRQGAPRLYVQGLGAGGLPATRIMCKILDRWSDPSSPNTMYPIRYYRWQNTYWTDPARNLPNPAPSADLIGKVRYWNIPIEIGGNPNNTMPPANTELRTAEYAIVSAGPDHKFGDDQTVSAAENAAAAADNIMEVGR